jgi:hypothetical protein
MPRVVEVCLGLAERALGHDQLALGSQPRIIGELAVGAGFEPRRLLVQLGSLLASRRRGVAL